MKRFIAYFDYLGFKEFILQNSEEELERRLGRFIYSITSSISEKHFQPTPTTLQVDLSESNINFLNISDTLIFWTKDDTVESCKELLEIAYRLNINAIQQFLPIRGCVVYDYFKVKFGQEQNEKGTYFGLNYMFGKGLINAHLKTEQLNWAGAVIDNSVVSRIENETQFGPFINDLAKEYEIPYKGFYRKEYAFLFAKESEMNQEIYERFIQIFKITFEMDSKSITPSVQEKMNNTFTFLKSHIKI
jgi:hypothetical protein